MEIFVRTVLQYNSQDSKNFKNRIFRKWRICFNKIILKFKIFPGPYPLLKIWIKVIKKFNPMMKVSLEMVTIEINSKMHQREINWREKKWNLVKLPWKLLQRLFYFLQASIFDILDECLYFWRLKSKTQINHKTINNYKEMSCLHPLTNEIILSRLKSLI